MTAQGEKRGRRHRLDTVLDLVIDQGHISVETLVTQLGISPATARRDLDTLADQQLVIRSYGGASANPDASSLPLRYRAARHAGAKEAIAAAAVDLVRPGSVIGADAFARIAAVDVIDDLVTDSEADAGVLEELRGAGIAVHIADEER